MEMDGWMDGWMDGSMDGSMDGLLLFSITIIHLLLAHAHSPVVSADYFAKENAILPYMYR